MTEGEWAGCFGGGDQAVDRLGVAGEGVGGRARPGGGERDGARGTGVWAVQERLPPVGSLVIVADQGGVGVGVHAFLPGHSRRGRGEVRGSVPPVPRVGRGRQSDGDVVAQQRDGVGLRGMRGGNKRGNVLVRVRHSLRPLIQARAIGMDRRGRVVQDLPRGWSLPRVITVPLPCNVRAHKWGRFSPIRQRHCVHCVTIALIVLRVGVRLCACISRIRQTDRVIIWRFRAGLNIAVVLPFSLLKERINSVIVRIISAGSHQQANAPHAQRHSRDFR